jgi:uncharacterized protein YprB with RNaseH-like and TPR domain
MGGLELNVMNSDRIWRAIPTYAGKIAFLDIETTGLSFSGDRITTIAVYDGNKVTTFVHGRNLNEFGSFITQFPAIATFYGTEFDIPFIQAKLGVELKQVHFDLYFILRDLGLKGGLKKIEKMLNISRDDLTDIDGFDAVRLWHFYSRTRNEKYLETLLAYNCEDVINLEYLLYYAYNELSRLESLNCPRLHIEYKHIERPFKADYTVLKKLFETKNRYANLGE